MMHKLLIFLLYLAILFTLFRTCEWYYYGLVGAVPQRIRPEVMTTKQLRAVLDHRGLSYTGGAVEKTDLVRFVQASGRLTAMELRDAESESKREELLALSVGNGGGTQPIEELTFTSGTHFYEQVEDCKDSAWLIQVISSKSGYQPLITERTWTTLSDKLKPFGIRFGVFDCKTAPRLCEVRKWNSSRLLLALPQSLSQTKGGVATQSYTGKFRVASILQWVYNTLGHNIKRFKKGSEVSLWFRNSCVTDVCLLLVSTLTLPPFFFSALTVKFTGRVNFATATPEAARNSLPGSSLLDSEEEEEREAGRNHPDGLNNRTSRTAIGRYLISTPQGEFRYGESTRRSLIEKLNFGSFCSVLRWVVPDLSDVLMSSLALVNLCAVASIFDIRGSPIQAMVHFGWTVVKYNFLLLFGWIIILSLAQREPFLAVGRLFLGFYRRLTFTWIGRLVTGDLLWLSQHIWTLSSTFFGFNMVVHYFRRRFWPQTLEEPEPWSEWLRFQRPVVILNPGRPTFFRSSSPEFEPRVRALIRKLNLTEYSVSSSLKFDFLFQLPVWSFGHSPEDFFQNQDKVLNNAGEVDEDWSCRSEFGVIDQSGFSTAPQHVHRSVCRVERESDLFDGEDHRWLCVRCKLVRVLKLRHLSARLSRKCCEKCGYAGFSRELISSDVPRSRNQGCAICLDSYQASDLVCGLPCGHSYHKNCVLSWLLTDPHQTCPCCRWPAYVARGDSPAYFRSFSQA